MVAGCYPCEMNARIDDLPPRERVHAEGGWRIAHAFNVSLPGWLVLLPTRHVTAMDELTVAEAEGFAHLHVHVVPRMPDFEPEVLGPRVFAFMGDEEADWLPRDEQDALALRLRSAMATAH